MSEEKKLILDMLSQGKITADEAQKLLEALDQPRQTQRPQRGERERHSSLVGGIVESIRSGLSNFAFSFDIGDSDRIVLEDRHTGTFADGVVKLDLRSRNGSIKVETWDQPGYQVDIIKRVRATTREQAEDIAAQWQYFGQQGNSLWAGDQQAKAAGNRINIALRVRLPRSHRYQGVIKTANGSVEITGLDGAELELGSVNGSVKVNQVSIHRLWAKTVNGSLRLEGGLEEVDASTTNGSITLVNIAEDSENRLHTVNGRVQVQVPARDDIGISIEARTASGTIRTQHANLSGMKIGKRLEATSRNWERASHRISLLLKSVNGSIRIEELE